MEINIRLEIDEIAQTMSIMVQIKANVLALISGGYLHVVISPASQIGSVINATIMSLMAKLRINQFVTLFRIRLNAWKAAMTRPLPNRVRMIRIRIAIEDMTLWDRLFTGYGAGPGAGPPSIEVFKLLLFAFMTNEDIDSGWCAVLLGCSCCVTLLLSRINGSINC